MNQRDLNRVVAQATGESVTTISRMGFVPLIPGQIDREPQFLDWDRLDEQRNVPLTRPRRPVAAIH
jgi:hypothetical protein